MDPGSGLPVNRRTVQTWSATFILVLGCGLAACSQPRPAAPVPISETARAPASERPPAANSETAPSQTPRSNQSFTAAPHPSATSPAVTLQPVATLDPAGPTGALSTAIPESAPPIDFDDSVVNILLLGRDTSRDAAIYRTDVIIVASVDRETNTVSLLSIPRDLFVWIPGWTMNRINTAAAHGDAIGYGENGVDLLKQTILYNLGLPIHHWIRIDFNGFKAAVDALGGISIPVSCALQDWRLKSPGLDEQDADNWEQFLLEPGIVQMDGDLALWYSRTRRSTNDFDRSRRQQQVLRSIFDRALSLDALTHAAELFGVFREFVDTDVDRATALSLLPVAAKLDRSRIRSRFISAEQVRGWRTPQGASVLLPQPELIQPLLAEAFAPARTNRSYDEPQLVAVRNGSSHAALLALAVDNLAWAGFAPIVMEDLPDARAATAIYDYSASPKGSLVEELQRVFQVDGEHVISQPDPAAAARYAVELGSEYVPCLHPVQFAAPAPTTDAPPIGEPLPAQVVVRAPLLEDEFILDAKFDEWEPFDYVSDIPVFGPENWWGEADAAMEWSVMWNPDFLLLAVRVSDDAFAQLATGRDIARGDGLELLLDTDLAGDASIDELSDDDYQLGLSPGDLFDPAGRPEGYLWLPQEKEGPMPLPMAFRRIENESDWEGEIMFPWALFDTIPTIGREYGFILSLNDNDRPGEIDLQSILTHVEGRVVTDPTTWGRLVLEPPRPEP